MRQAGEVTYADAHKQRRNEGWVAHNDLLSVVLLTIWCYFLEKITDENLCFHSVVEFATYSDMKAALDKLDDTELNGRRVRLIEDRGRRSRRSRSSSHSRSRSRSRSKRRYSRSHSRSSRYWRCVFGDPPMMSEQYLIEFLVCVM